MARMKLGDSLVLKYGERISVKPNKKDNASLFLSLSIHGLGPLLFLRSERPKEEEAVRDSGRSVAKNNKKNNKTTAAATATATATATSSEKQQ